MGIFGGVGLILGAFVLNYAMLMDIPNIIQQEVPVLYIAEQIHPIFGLLFAFILLQETFLTSAPMVWTVVDAFKGPRFTEKKRQWLVLVVNILALIGPNFHLVN